VAPRSRRHEMSGYRRAILRSADDMNASHMAVSSHDESTENTMNRRLAPLAAVSVCVGITAASAADLPRPSPAPVYTKAPAAVPYSWNGFYAGASVGGIWASENDTWTASPEGFGRITDLVSATGSSRLSGSGAIAGGQIGHNWTVSQQWLLGLEADWSYTGIRSAHDVAGASFVASSTEGFHSDLSSHWLATARGRVGYLTGDWLWYGTGGLAIANISNSDATSVPNPVRPFFPSTSSTSSNLGWTAGGGVEYAFGRTWSTKVEYLFVDVKGNDYVVGPDGIFVNATIGVHHDDLREHIARVGINYHLGN
jgi:outer membrane immunogenic protein